MSERSLLASALLAPLTNVLRSDEWPSYGCRGRKYLAASGPPARVRHFPEQVQTKWRTMSRDIGRMTHGPTGAVTV